MNGVSKKPKKLQKSKDSQKTLKGGLQKGTPKKAFLYKKVKSSHKNLIKCPIKKH